ncbi:MAG: hypothetical protein J0I65_20520 [Variovorax sp.]|nr:hypothetical protein [Variovorax sp.]
MTVPVLKATFNHLNVGTCERNQATYLEQHISAPPAGTVLDSSSGKIRQLETERSRIDGDKSFNEKPRLAVALDYLHVSSGVEGKGGMGPKGAIEVPLTLTNMKEGYPAQLMVGFSQQLAALDCLESIAIWIFSRGGTEEYERVKRGQWQRLTPTLVREKDPLKATLKFSGEEVTQLNLAMQSGVVARLPNPSKFGKGSEYRRIAQAFVEVTLRKPKPAGTGEDWAKDMLFENDPWVYPLDIQIGEAKLSPKSYWMFRRSAGERGEVPDWTWLYKTWGEVATKTGNQYPLPELVIRPYGPRPK